MRWDELTHSSRTLYGLKVSCMAGLRWVADRTPCHDTNALKDYAQAVHGACRRYLRGASVLDVGCGPGDEMRVFVEHYGAARCVGVDSSLGMIAALPKTATLRGAQVLLHDLTSLERGPLALLHRAYYTAVDGSYYRYTSGEWPDVIERARGRIVEAIDAGPRVITGRQIFFVLHPAARGKHNEPLANLVGVA